jgi:GT2 family glycosyltransferase
MCIRDRLLGFDATCEFPPYGIELPDDRDAVAFSQPFRGRIFDYEKLVHSALKKPARLQASFCCTAPGWDDTALLGNEARIYANGAPDKYNHWLSELIEDVSRRLAEDNRFIFINSWNDWQHGAHLEPDGATGTAYLEATRAALDGIRWSNGEFLEKHRYADWISQRFITDRQRRFFDERMRSAWPKRYEFHVAVVHDGSVPDSELMRTLQSLAKQYYRDVRISIVATAPPPATLQDSLGRNWHVVPAEQLLDVANACLIRTPADWVGAFRAGDTVSEYAFLSIGEAVFSNPDWRVAYTDDDEQDAAGNCLNYRFKPDFNLDFARSCPRYLGNVAFARHDLFAELGGLDLQSGSLPIADFVLRTFDTHGAAAIGHIPDVLVHLRRRAFSPAVLEESRQAGAALVRRHLARAKVDAVVEDGLLTETYRIRYARTASPMVSIIVPTKDKVPILQRCIESLLEKTRYPAYEVLIVDNGSETPEARDYLNGIRNLGIPTLKVIEYPHAFNFSAMNNLAARHASGDYLLLLNNDTAIVDENWLDVLVSHALRPEVGVVGARLCYPEGRVQHAGVLLGVKGPAEHPFIGTPIDAPGYMGRAMIEQDYSAVTGACMLVRRSLFEQVGGLDEVELKVGYSDIDLCLKIRELGYLVVWTPYAILLHEGSASQKSNVETKKREEKLARFEAEQNVMYRRWPRQLANDPAYNPNLALYSTQFQINTNVGLSRDPVSWKPVPNLIAMPADRQGSGHYRVIHPALFAHGSGMARSRIVGGYLPIASYEQLEIDTLFTQRQVSDDQLRSLRRFKDVLNCKIIMDFDDLLSAVPYRSVHKKDIFKDIGARLRMAAGVVDRITVSTVPLGEHFRGMGANVRVTPNALFSPVWENLNPLRRQSRKPRVGWAGGVSHDGDLAMIVDVVKELANEVEWVFMGMCPPSLRPYVAEFHPGADISLYPTRLATLNLDLAIAPLEQNKFNECKSNLRILEYGVLGYPVIATAFTPYEGDFPITLVKNRFKDWVAAIREHLGDLDETARRGDALRRHVRERWMIEQHMNTWLSAWTEW